MTVFQKSLVGRYMAEFIEVFPGAVFVHGDCVGADAEAHDIARNLGYRIHIRPPSDPSLRAWKAGDKFYQEKTYMARNRAIVSDADWMIAVPRSSRTGGTIKTLQYAKQWERPWNAFWPGGQVTGDGHTKFSERLTFS